MKSIEDFRKAGKELYERLHLSTWPVAIPFMYSSENLTPGFKFLWDKIQGA